MGGGCDRLLVDLVGLYELLGSSDQAWRQQGWTQGFKAQIVVIDPKKVMQISDIISRIVCLRGRFDKCV